MNSHLLQINSLKFSERTLGRILQITRPGYQSLLGHLSDLFTTLGIDHYAGLENLNEEQLHQLIDNLTDEDPNIILKEVTLRQLLENYGFDSELIDKIDENIYLDDPTFNTLEMRGKPYILKYLTEQLYIYNPDLIPYLIADYLFIELRCRGFNWKKLPIDVVISKKQGVTSDDLPYIPEGFSLDTSSDLAWAIAMDRGLTKLYLKSFKKTKVPNRDLLIIPNRKSDSRLVNILNNSRDPLKSILNAELNDDEFQLLYSQITEELHTKARRSTSNRQQIDMIDHWFTQDPKSANLSTSSVLLGGNVHFTDLHRHFPIKSF